LRSILKPTLALQRKDQGSLKSLAGFPFHTSTCFIQEPKLKPIFDVQALPKGSEGRHIMRVEARHYIGWNCPKGASGIRHKFILHHIRAMETMSAHSWSNIWRDGTQILTDNNRFIPMRFEGQDGVELLGRVTDVCSLASLHPLGDPEKAVKAHHMVNAKDARML